MMCHELRPGDMFVNVGGSPAFRHCYFVLSIDNVELAKYFARSDGHTMIVKMTVVRVGLSSQSSDVSCIVTTLDLWSDFEIKQIEEGRRFRMFAV
jgi:hypothetical protein